MDVDVKIWTVETAESTTKVLMQPIGVSEQGTPSLARAAEYSSTCLHRGTVYNGLSYCLNVAACSGLSS